jgi:RNA polymerase sigma-70 factor (ECF subfamily)
MRLAHDSDRADDLAQETFIRAMANIQLLELLNRHQRRSWLYRTLKNLFIDEQRSLKRRRSLFNQLALEMVDTVSTPLDTMSIELLDGVPERDRELLEQRYVTGLTSSEIARDQGVPAATVRSRLHLAVKRIRKQILEEGF